MSLISATMETDPPNFLSLKVSLLVPQFNSQLTWQQSVIPVDQCFHGNSQ